MSFIPSSIQASEIENSRVYLMDCIEGMKQYPDKYFDLAVVDPPYGIGESGKTNNTRSKLAVSKNYKSFYGDDNFAPESEYFDLLKRKSKNQIIWGSNHFIDNFPFMSNSSCWLIWDKENGENDFADCEMAWSSFKSATRIFRFKWQGMLQGDMKNKETRIHPTQKPIALYDWIYKNYSQAGMKILDTHLGSGSNRISAHKAGLDFTAFEIDSDYFEGSVKRFQNYSSQATLFPASLPVPQAMQLTI